MIPYLKPRIGQKRSAAAEASTQLVMVTGKKPAVASIFDVH